MKKPVSCAFNMDSGCVELKWPDGLSVSIICDKARDFGRTGGLSEKDFIILFRNISPCISCALG